MREFSFTATSHYKHVVYILISVDFGFAQYMSPWDEQRVLRGSPLYMAPEMVCQRQYDSRVDLWSVGVILFGEFDTYNMPYINAVQNSVPMAQLKIEINSGRSTPCLMFTQRHCLGDHRLHLSLMANWRKRSEVTNL